MIVTRHSLKCKTKECPFTPDEHEEWMALCRQAPEHGHRDDQLSHQHHPKKGMGGHNSKSKIVAILCWPMHDRIDNRDWGNAVITTIEDGQRIETYRAWGLHNETLIERVISVGRLSDGAEGGTPGALTNAPSSAPSLRKEESDGVGTVHPLATAAVSDRASDSGGSSGGIDGPDSASASSGLTHEQRVAIAQEPEWAELDAVAQEEWFQGLVTDCCDIGRAEHGGIINSKWYMGARICEEERLWPEGRSQMLEIGSKLYRVRAKYGTKLIGRLSEELVKEFGKGHGYGRSELFQSIQFADKAPENELSALSGQFRTWKRIKREYLSEGQRDTEPEWPKWLRPFDVWNFQIDENYGQLHPGRIPAGIVQNAIHYFSNEGDLVVDPMAGGGVVLDVCEEMGRECVALDVSPARADIRQWDIAQGYPDEANGAALVFCDPPYFNELKSAYGSASISALPRTEYLAFFDKFAQATAAILPSGGYLAFLMSDYVEIGDGRCDEPIFTWDYAKRFEAAGLAVIRRIYCPLSTQQIGGDIMNKLREAGRMSKLVRELLICRKV